MGDLEALATQLRSLRETLRTQMNNATAADSDRLYLQILEINHRVQMLNSLLFSTGTAQLAAHQDALKAATEEVGDAIRDIEGLANVIGAVKNILGIVDGVIDLLA
ncbi:hypothetical protein HZY97_06395 [Sphingomonas sp. R-74633]|nr:hypothetical protein [Sphingomonas sp. R-74633]